MCVRVESRDEDGGCRRLGVRSIGSVADPVCYFCHCQPHHHVRRHTYRLEIEGESPSRKGEQGEQGEMERMERGWTNEASWTHPLYLAILMDNALYRGKWETKKVNRLQLSRYAIILWSIN